MSFTLGEPISFDEYLDRCLADSKAGEWMVYTEQEGYRLNMPIYPVILDDWDMSAEDFATLESTIQAAGYRYCLKAEELEDIVFNLEDQKVDYRPHELEQALTYYATNRQFIVL